MENTLKKVQSEVTYEVCYIGNNYMVVHSEDADPNSGYTSWEVYNDDGDDVTDIDLESEIIAYIIENMWSLKRSTKHSIKIKLLLLKQNNMKLTENQKLAQFNIENVYGVKMYPLSSTFQMKMLDFYIEKGRLSEKQVEAIRNPKYPVKAY